MFSSLWKALLFTFHCCKRQIATVTRKSCLMNIQLEAIFYQNRSTNICSSKFILSWEKTFLNTYQFKLMPCLCLSSSKVVTDMIIHCAIKCYSSRKWRKAFPAFYTGCFEDKWSLAYRVFISSEILNVSKKHFNLFTNRQCLWVIISISSGMKIFLKGGKFFFIRHIRSQLKSKT